ncbi:MAG: hypothetical protein ABSH01_18415 [Terriglobia bacterium]
MDRQCFLRSGVAALVYKCIYKIAQKKNQVVRFTPNFRVFG